MAEKFNLLPEKKQQSSAETKLVKIFKRIAIVSFVVSVFVFVGGFAALFIFNNNLKRLKQDVIVAQNQVSTLETAELSLVVSKDRAQKLQKILDLRKNELTYQRYVQLDRGLPPSVGLSRVEINDTTSEVTFLGSNSKDFSDFLDKFVLNESDYKVIFFNNVGVDATTGYKLVLEIH